MREGLIRWESGASGELPGDWKEQAARRLGFVAATAVAIGVVALALSFLRHADVGARAGAEQAAAWWATATLESKVDPMGATEEMTPLGEADTLAVQSGMKGT